jgi:general stress protein 26
MRPQLETLETVPRKLHCNDMEVARFLASAAKVVSSAPYCWLVTHAQIGDANARPMGRVRPNADEKDWIIRFVTDGRSRKASEIRCSGRVKLVFQHEGDDAFVLLSGLAKLLEGRSALRQHWKDAYCTYFPTQTGRASAAFIELAAQRMELWIRGVTPEPFGLRPTVLERNLGGRWHVVPDGRAIDVS